MSKDIVVELTRAVGTYPKGAELGFASEAKATSTLGDGAFKVVRNQDGTAIDAPKPQKAADAPEPAKKG